MPDCLANSDKWCGWLVSKVHIHSFHFLLNHLDTICSVVYIIRHASTQFSSSVIENVVLTCELNGDLLYHIFINFNEMTLLTTIMQNYYSQINTVILHDDILTSSLSHSSLHHCHNIHLGA